jgi:membrane fusion protein, multidrug efflux system
MQLLRSAAIPFFWLFLLLVSVLLLPACSGEKQGPPPVMVPVLVAEVKAQTVPVTLRQIGNVEPYATVNIKSRLAGQVVKVNFKEGQDVKQGDLLFVIDPRPYEAALKQAEANLEKDKALAGKAKGDLTRYAELIRKQFVSQQDYDQAKATAESLTAVVNADQVAVQNARLNLSYCYIKAPITGRTGNLLANEGNMIKENADTAMLVINQIQPIYVSFSVPEKNLPTLKKFMAEEKIKVEAIFPHDPEHPEEGVLTFINNTVDLASGTIQCKATYDNVQKRLWPGLFVNVLVKLTEEPDTILVPSQAIQSGQQGQFVWVVKPDLTAEPRTVVTERTVGGEVVVKQGLQAGERVVIDGQIRLVKGAKVEIKTGL